MKNELKNDKLKLFRLPAAFLAAGWPFIVRAAALPTHLEQYPWFPDVSTTTDFFLHYRRYALYATAALMLAMLIAGLLADRNALISVRKRAGRNVRRSAGINKGINAGLVIFAAGALLSSLLSPYRSVVWNGISEHYEGLAALLSYAVIFAFTAFFFRKEEEKAFLIKALLIGAALQCLIGLLQITGNDILQTQIGRTLIGAGSAESNLTDFTFSGDGSHKVYLCFYHPNYAAVYLMLMLPLCVGSLRGKKTPEKACLCILMVCMIICLAGTGSKTALAVLAVSVLYGSVRFLYRKLLAAGNKKSRKRQEAVLTAAASITTAVIIVCCTVFIFKSGSVSGLRSRILGEKTEQNLKDVSLQTNGILVSWKDKKIMLTMQQEDGSTWFAVTDESGKDLRMDFNKATQRFTLTDQAYTGLSFDAWTDKGKQCVTMYQGEIPWYFQREKAEDTWQYITLYRKPDVPMNAQHSPTFGYDNALSGRMYIWSRTLPMLPKRILLGSGADSFALAFPQNDYAAKANVGLDLLMPVISRAHSLYLQNSVQYGIIPAIALTMAMILLLSRGRRFSMLHPETAGSYNAASLSLSIAWWLLMGITNDSVIVITPFICLIAGISAL